MGLGLESGLVVAVHGAGLLMAVLDEDVQRHELVELRGAEREQHGAPSLRPAHGLRPLVVLQDLGVPEEVAAAEGALGRGTRDPPLEDNVEGERRLEQVSSKQVVSR